MRIECRDRETGELQNPFILIILIILLFFFILLLFCISTSMINNGNSFRNSCYARGGIPSNHYGEYYCNDHYEGNMDIGWRK